MATADLARHWLRIQRRAMACRFEMTLDQADAAAVPAAQAAFNQIEAIEARLTVFRETSAIVELNRHAAAAAMRCDAELFSLLSRCAALSRDTEGAFDITSTPLSRCWGFLQREGRVPAEHEIAAARALVGMHHVQLHAAQSSVRFSRPGIELNLGAVGKGYALDRVAETLRSNDVGRTLLSAGRSSLLAIGRHGRGWSIDLVSPRRPAPLARVWLRDAALGTSGAGTQFATIDGKRYGHVIDPRSGAPSEGMLSASVICRSATDADALSTAFFVGGPTLAQRYCEQHPGVLALLTPDDDSGTTLVIGECAHADVEDA
jgi:thiamine biosynthesis lipoprotein